MDFPSTILRSMNEPSHSLQYIAPRERTRFSSLFSSTWENDVDSLHEAALHPCGSCSLPGLHGGKGSLGFAGLHTSSHSGWQLHNLFHSLRPSGSVLLSGSACLQRKRARRLIRRTRYLPMILESSETILIVQSIFPTTSETSYHGLT
jgi:hypothetical protein